MSIPELKQFGELCPADFERHPIWIGCHTADYGKPWYDDTNEETFRAYRGALPADPSMGILLVRATFHLRDGTPLSGFVTPASVDGALGTQQPHIFLGEDLFGFWGGMARITTEDQQALYFALEKSPDAIFPIQFGADPGLATGFASGQLEGFYSIAQGLVHLEKPSPRSFIASPTGSPSFFELICTSRSGYPQPEDVPAFRKIVYANQCPRCGIHDGQIAPFRFKHSVPAMTPKFSQLNWVFDAFFVHREIATEITNAGITGASFGPAVHHRSGRKLEGLMQLLIPTTISCAETSLLPTVTCRPNNEEYMSMRAKYGGPEQPEREPDSRPYCGRVRYHPPTSLALRRQTLQDAPDLVQAAEWFGSGGLAYRLTLASEHFVALARERKWKGLKFRPLRPGLSKREMP
jgi:hypothetical protein